MIHGTVNVSSPREFANSRITRPVPGRFHRRRKRNLMFIVRFAGFTAKSVCYNDKEEIIRVVLYNDFVISRLSLGKCLPAILPRPETKWSANCKEGMFNRIVPY